MCIRDRLHITSGSSTTILGIAGTIQTLFKEMGRKITVIPDESKDEVQKDARNISDPYIKKWWQSKTSVPDGIAKVFEVMKHDWV